MKAFPNSWYIPQIMIIGVAVGGQVAQPVGDEGQVVLDPGLPGVLAAAAHEQVRVSGRSLAGVVVVDAGVVAVPADPLREAPGVAEVAVDGHLARVEVDEVDGPCCHAVSSPKPASP